MAPPMRLTCQSCPVTAIGSVVSAVRLSSRSSLRLISPLLGLSSAAVSSSIVCSISAVSSPAVFAAASRCLACLSWFMIEPVDDLRSCSMYWEIERMDAASARTHSPRRLIRPDLAATRSDISLSVRSISPMDTRQSKATMWSRPSWGAAVASSSSRRCMWAVTAWRRHILGSITIMPRSRSRGTASLMNERSSSVVRYTSQSPALSTLRSAATRGESGSGRSGLR